MATYQFVSVTCITPSTGVSGIATKVISTIGSVVGGSVAGSLSALTGPRCCFYRWSRIGCWWYTRQWCRELARVAWSDVAR